MKGRPRGVEAPVKHDRRVGFSENELTQLCALSCINLETEEEKLRVKEDLSTIVSWMDQIREVEVADLTSFNTQSHPSLSSSSLEIHSFEDHSVELGAERILANAPIKKWAFL